jgi:tetratricopeptide (TPR) repeat protein
MTTRLAAAAVLLAAVLLAAPGAAQDAGARNGDERAAPGADGAHDADRHGAQGGHAAPAGAVREPTHPPAHAGTPHGGVVPEGATVPLYDDLGTRTFPVTTSSELAQRYVDQGMRLVYAFNHAEAIRAFEQAARLDPGAPMPHWGVALALGPNINLPMDPAAEPRAHAEAQRAVELAAGASERERAYVEALAVRYGPEAGERRAAKDSAYASAMREVSGRFPDDLDAATLYAEALMDLAPWNYWTAEYEIRPGMEELVPTLESVLARDIDHAGACHYYIHAVEVPTPEKALACAERIPVNVPGAGHLVHMPTHLYLRLGRWADAIEGNLRAAAVDHAYVEAAAPEGFYPALYVPHNVHFLSFAASMMGDRERAVQWARETAALLPLESARAFPPLQFWVPLPALTLVRYGRWEEVLREPEPPADLAGAHPLWRYARGRALAATGRLDEAEADAAAVAAAAAAYPEGQLLGGAAQGRQVLGVAAAILAADLQARRGELERAIATLREAARLEDGIPYMEPPDWPEPVRPRLGELLLRAGRAEEAETAFREDLRRFPENGFSLHGLARSLRAQGDEAGARDAEARLAKAWTGGAEPLVP